MSTKIVLMPVQSLKEEASLAKQLPIWRAHFSGTVVPILDHGGLLRRIEKVLNDNGVKTEIQRLTELPRNCLQPDATALVGPGILVASPGTDPNLSLLAAGLCSTATIRLPVTENDLRYSISDRNRTALILLNPDATSPSLTLDLLKTLEAHDIRWGLLYAIHPLEARFTLIKSLLINTISASGKFAFISDCYSPGKEEHAPKCLRNLRDPITLELFCRDQDVLILSGHSNALDMSLGDEAILCAREGNRKVASGPDLFPCYKDGRCFRQHPTQPNRQLISMSQNKSKITVVTGCDLFPFGRSCFRTVAGLAYQAGQGDGIALIAASVACVGALELDLLGLFLMGEGIPLGEVVHLINQFRREAMGHSTGLPPGIGPFVLMGNPTLRLHNFPLHSCIVTEMPSPNHPEEQKFHLDLHSVRPSPESGALLRAPMPIITEFPCLQLKEPPFGSWCRGVWRRQLDETILYLWLGESNCRAFSDANRYHLSLSAHKRNPWGPARKTVNEVLGELPFWAIFIDSYIEEMRDRDLPSSRLGQLLEDIPRFRGVLSNASLGMESEPGMLISKESLTAYFRSVWVEIGVWADALLEAIVPVRLSGPLHSYAIGRSYRLAGCTGPVEDCFCGDGIVTGQVFESADARIRRIEYQCGICGACSDEDGRRLVRITQCPRRVHIGNALACCIHYHAPKDAQLQIHFVQVLETWRNGKRIVGDIYRDVLSPGTESSVTLSIDIPDEITEGVYPVTIIGIVNGALYIFRRMVQVEQHACLLSNPEPKPNS
jgi:hypothetical protein